MSIRFECLSCGRMFEIGHRGFEHVCDYGMVEDNHYSPLFQKIVDQTLDDLASLEAEITAERAAFHEASWLTEHVGKARYK